MPRYLRPFAAPENSGTTTRDPDTSAKVGRLAIESPSNISLPIEGTVSIVGPDGFELSLVDELQSEILKLGFKNVRQQFSRLIEDILADPFGTNSIDISKDADQGQWARLVHKVEGPLANLIPGKKLAIKGTGLEPRMARTFLEGGVKRAKLADQFRTTLRLSRDQKQKAPDGIGGSVFINEVYGLVSYTKPDGDLQEWLLMEHVDGGVPLETELVLHPLGRRYFEVFDPVQYPELYRLIMGDFMPPQGIVTPMGDLALSLSQHLGYASSQFGDFNNHGILKRTTPGGDKYTIIDVQAPVGK